MTILVMFEQLSIFLAVFEQLFIESCLNYGVALYFRLRVMLLERLLG